MDNPKACPMCLTDTVTQNNEDINRTILKEYWEPEKKWKLLECLSNEMTLFEKVSEPDFITKAAGQNNYQSDFEQKKK